MNQPKTELLKQFDKDGDKRLNAAERKAARESIAKRGDGRRQGGPGGRGGFMGERGESQEPPKPGPRVSPAEVEAFPGASFYASNVIRTVFLDFENADWEKELEDFHNTDVEVPAKLTVDGKTYPDVGVHFRGASSYMMVGSGRKRSLNLSLDFVHKDQNVGGYRTLNLLNSHGDPTFLRAVLYYDIARAYVPAPKANWVRLVINGESWGVYVSLQQFNKDFVKEWFGTKDGARWKVPGSPHGQGNLGYLGDDPASYKRIYEIKSKDDAKSWAALIRLCKTLKETPAAQLEAALDPMLDIDGALKFLALENALVNNDGYWVRTSDYDLYLDEKGRFHVIPYDANETFSTPGGPGFGGGPGGRGGPGGPGDFGPGMLMAPEIMANADKNNDQKLTQAEFMALADQWFDKLSPNKAEKVTQAQFTVRIAEVLPMPDGPPGFGGLTGGASGDRQRGGGRREEFSPATMIGSGLFAKLDASKDGSLTRAELKETFAQWFREWPEGASSTLTEDAIARGLNRVIPQPDFAGPAGGQGGRRDQRGFAGQGFGGRRGPGGGVGSGGSSLDPLIAANDSDKPLISKLLAVPSLRARYLGYVRDIADRWLDWKTLGSLTTQYQTLLADAVKADTKKLSTFEAFQNGVAGGTQIEGSRGPGRTGSLKSFAEQRRAYLLGHAEIQKLQR